MGRLVMKIRLRDKSGVRLYRYVVEDVDRHGNLRIYFKRKKASERSALPKFPALMHLTQNINVPFAAKSSRQTSTLPRSRKRCGGSVRNTMRRPNSNRLRRVPARIAAGTSKRFVSAPAISATS